MAMEEGSSNVFADTGLTDPDERQAKADLAIGIEAIIKAAGWTQEEAARRMGLTQPDVSDIVRGRLRRFTWDRLFRCLIALGRDVQISVRPKQADRERGRVLVTCR